MGQFSNQVGAVNLYLLSRKRLLHDCLDGNLTHAYGVVSARVGVFDSKDNLRVTGIEIESHVIIPLRMFSLTLCNLSSVGLATMLYNDVRIHSSNEVMVLE